jgi:hypothetical protein
MCVFKQNVFKQNVFKQNVCLITFDKFLTNVKLFHVYIKVHNTTSDIGHKPAISNMFNRFEIFAIFWNFEILKFFLDFDFLWKFWFFFFNFGIFWKFWTLKYWEL